MFQRPSQPRAQKPAGIRPGLQCHYSSFIATPASSRVVKLIINVSRLQGGNLEMRLVGCRFFFPFFGVGHQGLSPGYCSLFPEKDAGIPPVTGTPRKGPHFPICGTAPSPPRGHRGSSSCFLSTLELAHTFPPLPSETNLIPAPCLRAASRLRCVRPEPSAGSLKLSEKSCRVPASVPENLRPAQQVPWGIFSGPCSVGLWAEAKVSVGWSPDLPLPVPSAPRGRRRSRLGKS